MRSVWGYDLLMICCWRGRRCLLCWLFESDWQTDDTGQLWPAEAAAAFLQHWLNWTSHFRPGVGFNISYFIEVFIWLLYFFARLSCLHIQHTWWGFARHISRSNSNLKSWSLTKCFVPSLPRQAPRKPYKWLLCFLFRNFHEWICRH